jgi:peptidoglycan endopeptidase LytE
MVFRAVGNRCAVDLQTLNLPVDQEEALKILVKAGLAPIAVDLIQLARSLLKAKYRRGAYLWLAPKVFDCYSFTKYLYGQRGIWLPRRSIQQRERGSPVGIHNPLQLVGGGVEGAGKRR